LENATFSLSDFYVRRVKRIFPALLLMMLATYVIGWCTLLASEFAQLGKHLAGGAGFISNVLFWSEAGYFDNSAETKPFLHLWSLSIEEQFYVFWPVILFLSWKRRIRFWVPVSIIGILSFLFCCWQVPSDRVAAFYSPITRAWELLVGAGLAYVTLYFPHILSKRKLIHHTSSLVGLALIGISCFYLNEKALFPGLWALPPTLGALCILAAGPHAWGNRFFLSHRVAVWIGLISYPLYLWHWPLLSFGQILTGGPLHPARVRLVVGISFLLAWLTYRWMETPIRKGKKSARSVQILCFLMIMMGGVGFYSFLQGGFSDRKANENTFELDDRWNKESCESLHVFSDPEEDFCYTSQSTLSQSSFSDELLVVGDSHSSVFSGILARMREKYAFSFLGLGRGQNPLLLEGQKDAKLGEAALEIAKKHKSIHTVVLAAHWPVYLSETNDLAWQEWEIAIKKTIQTYMAIGKKVVFVYEAPTGIRIPYCLRAVRMRRHFGGESRENCSLSLEEARERESTYTAYNYRTYVETLKKEFPELRTVDLWNYLCTEKACTVVNEKHQTLYVDDNHLGVAGSEWVAERGGDEIAQILGLKKK